VVLPFNASPFDLDVDTAQTIIAIASPPGRSVRGIIRLAGTDVPALLDVLCERSESLRPSACGSGTGGESVSARRTRSVYSTYLKLQKHTLPVLLLNYNAPHSYTAEHAAELFLPGNPVLLQRVVDHIIETARDARLDVRHAEPGEFSARAFFNNKLTLTQAEGVAATIAARSDAELRAAAMMRSDTLGSLATQLADELATALALLEAGIDFTDEEDVVAITPDDLRTRLNSIRSRIQQQLERAVGSEQLEAAPWVVLTGKPNAGKSTLFNALLGRRRAIVSTVAGTTRDVLVEPMHIRTDHGDAEVMLVDLAGADTDDPTTMNRHMQHAADRARQRADLLLRCVPAGESTLPATSPRELLVRTKSDACDARPDTDQPAIAVSAATGSNLDVLRRRIADRLAERAVSLSGDAVVLRPRHEAELRSAAEAVDDALATLQHSTGRHIADPELVAAALRTALDHLGNLAGRVTPDDVLGKIFAEFCIGK